MLEFEAFISSQIVFEHPMYPALKVNGHREKNAMELICPILVYSKRIFLSLCPNI